MLAVLFVLLAVAAFLVAYRLRAKRVLASRQRVSAGSAGERRVHALVLKAGFECLHDVVLPLGRGTVQLDLVVRGADRLVVVEVKTWRGVVTARPGAAVWSVAGPAAHWQTANPLRQVSLHAEVLGRVLRVPTDGLVAMAGSAQPASGAFPPGVIPLRQLIASLRQAAVGPPSARLASAWATLNSLANGPPQQALARRHQARVANRARPGLESALGVAGLALLGAAFWLAPRGMSYLDLAPASLGQLGALGWQWASGLAGLGHRLLG